MGIRFYCPNGHKLNVKEFQAGRLGICPFCGARSQIPMQSTRPSAKGGRQGGGRANSPTTDDPDSAQVSDSSPDILPGEPPSLPGDPAGGKMLGPSKPPGVTAVSGPVVAPPSRPTGSPAAASAPTPASLAALRSAPMRQPLPAPSQPVRPDAPRMTGAQPGAAVSAQAGMGMPSSAATAPAAKPATAPSAPIAPTQPAAPAQPAAPVQAAPAPATPTASEPPDPIAEAPDMIWYVRPPSGGQFGPATGELMRTWLDEGRVSADSLVWREGWRDWQEASKVFAKLRGNQIVDFLETAPVVSVVAAVASHTHRPKAKKSSDRTQLAIVVGFSVLVVILTIVLLWIVFHPT